MQWFFKKYFCREYIVKVLLCAIGVFFIGLGIGSLRYANFGLDPFMCIVTGINNTVFIPRGIDFGTGYLIFNFSLLLLVFIFDRSKIGFGTVLNMTLPGYVSELALFVYRSAPVEGGGMFMFRIAALVTGIMVICIGSGLYLNTSIGTSPYDAAGLIITEKAGNQTYYRWARIGTDCICVTAGFFMGTMPGAGTIIMAFFTGPLFAFFRRRFLLWGRHRGIITWT